MRTSIALLVVSGLAASANAQVAYNGGVYNEDFNSLTAAASPFSATVGVQAAIPGLSTWRGAKIAGSGTTALPWTVSTGGSNSGSLFSFGQPAGDADRALGSLASGSNAAAFGVEFVNTSTDPIDSFTLGFTGEQYRSSTSTQNILAFAWGVSGGLITSSNFLSDAGMTVNTAGDIVGQAPVGSNGEIPVATLGPSSVTITGLNVDPGSSIFVRWSDFNDVGNDAGLAIDNLTFSATFVPTPGAAALLGLGILAAGRRRR